MDSTRELVSETSSSFTDEHYYICTIDRDEINLNFETLSQIGSLYSTNLYPFRHNDVFIYYSKYNCLIGDSIIYNASKYKKWFQEIDCSIDEEAMNVISTYKAKGFDFAIHPSYAIEQPNGKYKVQWMVKLIEARGMKAYCFERYYQIIGISIPLAIKTITLKFIKDNSFNFRMLSKAIDRHMEN